MSVHRIAPPSDWGRARFTLVLAAIIGAAWLVLWLGRPLYSDDILAGFVPERATQGLARGDFAYPVIQPLTAIIVQAGFLHLALNFVALLACGRAVENIVGRWELLSLFLIGAYVAAAAYYFVDPHAATSLTGAGGAVGAVVGAYAMLLGRGKLKTANPRLGVWLNALWLGAAWTVLQVMATYTLRPAEMIAAAAAPLAAVVTGLVLAKPLLLLHYRKA